MNKILKIIFEKQIVKTSLKVALIVGIILNLINQGNFIINLDFEKISVSKIILTFIVPYLVSTYSAVVTKIYNT